MADWGDGFGSVRCGTYPMTRDIGHVRNNDYEKPTCVLLNSALAASFNSCWMFRFSVHFDTNKNLFDRM